MILQFIQKNNQKKKINIQRSFTHQMSTHSRKTLKQGIKIKVIALNKNEQDWQKRSETLDMDENLIYDKCVSF